MAMTRTSVFSDFLMLIGILPLKRPGKKLPPKITFGYQGYNLKYYSKEDLKSFSEDRKKLLNIIK